MKTMKKILYVILGTLSLALAAENTPITEAIKLSDQIKGISYALAYRGVNCDSFSNMSNAIMNADFVQKFVSGEYVGPITVTCNSLQHKCFYNLTGDYTIYAPNLLNACEGSFQNAVGLKSISVPSIVSTPKSFAAGCTSITTVNLPSCITLGESSFSGCTSLQNVYVPLCTTAGNYSFQNCTGIQEVELPKCVKVGNYAFSGSSVKNLKTLPLTSIGEQAFKNTDITNVTLNLDGCSIGDYAFDGCSSLKNIKTSGKLTFNEGSFSNCGILEADLSEMVELSKSQVFRSCTSMTNVIMNDMVMINGYDAFRYTYALKELNAPNLVQFNSGADYCFESSGITNIYAPKLEYIYPYWVFSACKSLKRIDLPSLRHIEEEGAFKTCSKVTEISMPALEKINDFSTFAYNTSLTNVYLPSLSWINQSYVPNADYGTFGYCTALKEITIPNLQKITYAPYIFGCCYSLKKASFPSLTEIYSNNSTKNMANMFNCCYSLLDVTTGLTSSELLSYSGFPGGASLNTVFHCPSESPYNVSVMYENGSWQSVTNSTIKLVDYIKSTGTQYMNSGVIHGTNTTIICDCWLGQVTNKYGNVFGARKGDVGYNDLHVCSQFNFEQKFSYCRSGSGTSGEIVGSVYEDGRYTIVVNKNNMKVYSESGELVQDLTSTGTNDAGVCPIGIFCCNKSSTQGGFTPATGEFAENMKLYRFTVYEGDELQIDMIPALIQDEIPCMVDVANDYHPYFNYGTGIFEYGSITNSAENAASN